MPHGVTYEDVVTVCDLLKEAGEKISTRKVREKLGEGSLSTILNHLNRWKSGQPAKLVKPDMSKEFETTNTAKADYERLDAAYKAELEKKLAELQAEKDAEIQAIEAELEEHRAVVADAARENDELKDQIEKLKAEKHIWLGKEEEKNTTIEEIKKAFEREKIDLRSDLKNEREARVAAEIEAARYKALADERERKPDKSIPTALPGIDTVDGMDIIKLPVQVPQNEAESAEPGPVDPKPKRSRRKKAE